jgi:putative transposase
MTQKYQFVADHASQYPVIVICRVLGLARSGYYAWRSHSISQRTQQDEVLAQQIKHIFVASRQTYGSPRIHAELRAQGLRCARKRVARLMRQANLVARPRRRCIRTTDSRHTHPIAPNRLERHFTSAAPNLVWVTDITYLATREGWLYLAVVLDLFARRVVGWSMQASLERGLVVGALRHAYERRERPVGVLHHSDRGSQYASTEYQEELARAKMQVSISRAGNCWDNAAMESFFATLKAELPMAVFPDHATARRAVFDYIERFYNRQRRHSTLGYLSPVDYEEQFSERMTGA